MRVLATLFFSGLLIFSSCGNQMITANRLLADEVMAIHDEAMAKMGYMHELKQGLRERGADAAMTEEAAEAIASLEKAHRAMMAWMRDYKPPLTDEELAGAKDYLQAEKVKISEVRQLINRSIEQAEKIKPLE